MHEKIMGASLPSVMALAYLGDARHALYVREMLVKSGLSKPKDLNLCSLDYVTAEAQAEMYRRIEHLLTEDELDVVRRAGNSGHLNRPKHASPADYRAATGFEALVGMLYYINDNERLTMLLDLAHKTSDEGEEK